jgi:hypothetical protein
VILTVLSARYLPSSKQIITYKSYLLPITNNVGMGRRREEWGGVGGGVGVESGVDGRRRVELGFSFIAIIIV